VLSALSRFDETPGELVVELTERGYVSHGDVAAVATMEAEAKLLELLPRTHDDPVSMDAMVAGDPDLSRRTLQRILPALIERGLVKQEGTGRRGDPFRFRRSDAAFHSAPPTVGVRPESNTATRETPELVSAPTPTLGGAGSNRPGTVPGNVVFIEDRRAPWEDEPEVVSSDDEPVADLPLVADLAAGCIEPDTCAELGACGEGGAPVCGPAAGPEVGPAVQPTLDVDRAPWSFDRVGDPGGRGRVAS
jgi:hypothetical protein